jgi:hypothetical protein
VAGAPNKISRRTVGEVSRISAKLRLKPPSNSTMATAMDTSGDSNGPKVACGSSWPNTGPTRKPAASKSTIAGHCVRQAIHCAPTPSTPMSATSKTTSAIMAPSVRLNAP